MTAPEIVDAVAKAMCIVETRSKAASLEEVQAGIQRWTRHRYEAERLIEELKDGGVHVALSTPPADDVREALALTIAKSFPGWSEDTAKPQPGWDAVNAWAYNERVNQECIRQGRAHANAILADRAIEVRMRGTVTDAEVQWQYRASFPGGGIRHATDAETVQEWAGKGATVVRRRAFQPAGQWELMPEGTES